MATDYVLCGRIDAVPTIRDELDDWLRIPSVSTGGRRRGRR